MKNVNQMTSHKSIIKIIKQYFSLVKILKRRKRCLEEFNKIDKRVLEIAKIFSFIKSEPYLSGISSTYFGDVVISINSRPFEENYSKRITSLEEAKKYKKFVEQLIKLKNDQ